MSVKGKVLNPIKNPPTPRLDVPVKPVVVVKKKAKQTASVKNLVPIHRTSVQKAPTASASSSPEVSNFTSRKSSYIPAVKISITIDETQRVPDLSSPAQTHIRTCETLLQTIEQVKSGDNSLNQTIKQFLKDSTLLIAQDISLLSYNKYLDLIFEIINNITAIIPCKKEIESDQLEILSMMERIILRLFQSPNSLIFIKFKINENIRKFIINYLNLLYNVDNVSFNISVVPLIYTSVTHYVNVIEYTLIDIIYNVIEINEIPSLFSTMCDMIIKIFPISQTENKDKFYNHCFILLLKLDDFDIILEGIERIAEAYIVVDYKYRSILLNKIDRYWPTLNPGKQIRYIEFLHFIMANLLNDHPFSYYEMKYIQKIIIKGIDSNIWKVTEQSCKIIGDDFITLLLSYPDLLLPIMNALQKQAKKAINDNTRTVCRQLVNLLI